MAKSRSANRPSFESEDLEQPLVQDYDGQREESRLALVSSQRHNIVKLPVLPWLISAILTIMLVVQHVELQRIGRPEAWMWRPFEVEAATQVIRPQLKEIQFTGGLQIIDGYGLYREVGPSSPAYVGPPSKDIDDAWSNLIEPTDLFMRPDELEGHTDNMSVDPETGLYVVMLQGLHDLHCLNMIRKAIYPLHYPQSNATTFQTHIDHCIDSLRQGIMCAADMTLIKNYWIEKRHRMMSNFDNLHVCRDFEAMKDWTKQRDASNETTWRKNADALLAAKPA